MPISWLEKEVKYNPTLCMFFSGPLKLKLKFSWCHRLMNNLWWFTSYRQARSLQTPNTACGLLVLGEMKGLINSYLDYVASTFDVNPGLVHSEELDSLEVPQSPEQDLKPGDRNVSLPWRHLILAQRILNISLCSSAAQAKLEILRVLRCENPHLCRKVGILKSNLFKNPRCSSTNLIVFALRMKLYKEDG